MTVSATRRAFLTGRSSRAELPFRPPWAVAENRFTDLCDRCVDCRTACPEEILIRGDGGFPEILFNAGECTFCGDCRTACPTGALNRDPEALPWRVDLELTAACLALRGVVCRVCGDLCQTRAIRFRLAVGGGALPQIDGSACTGCGACVSPCPVGAIRLHRIDKEA